MLDIVTLCQVIIMFFTEIESDMGSKTMNLNKKKSDQV